MKIIIIMGRKGGIGKSLISWSLFCKYTNNLKDSLSKYILINTDSSSDSVGQKFNIMNLKEEQKRKVQIESILRNEVVGYLMLAEKININKTYIIDLQGDEINSMLIHRLKQFNPIWIIPMLACDFAIQSCYNTLNDLKVAGISNERIICVVNSVKKDTEPDIEQEYEKVILQNKYEYPYELDEKGNKEMLICPYCPGVSKRQSKVLSLASGKYSGSIFSIIIKIIKTKY